jgi:DNA primase
LISPDTIALVRERTDIVALIREGVPSLKRRGRSWVGLCPFHKEKTGSFHVNADRGFFHCFGCKESGSAIDFLMKQEGTTFPEAVRALAERAGIPIEEEQAPRAEVDRQKKQRDSLYAASQLAATYFEQQLREHPHRSYALGELSRRGLVPSWALHEMGSAGQPPSPERQTAIDEALQAFRIGYAPPGWDGLAVFLRQQGISPMAAEGAGLLVPRSSGTGHYDRFRHRLMFSVIDIQGRVIAFSGRALPALPDERSSPSGDDKPAKYINSPESPIYSKGATLFGLYQARHAIRQAESATLVEGNFDVVSLHAHGVANVVAPLGTAFTADQAKLLKRFASNLVLLFDADAAGHKAVRAARETCREAGLTAKVASLPTGHDPDDFVRTRGAGALQQVVGQALGMLEFLLEQKFESLRSADIYEKKEVVDSINRLLSEENDPLVRSMAKTYVDRLAGRLDLHLGSSFQALERTIQQGLAQAGPRPVQGPTQREARVTAKPAGSMEMREIVGALIEFPSLLVEPDVEEVLALLEGPSVSAVAALGRAMATSDHMEASDVPHPGGESRETREKSLDTSSFLAQIPPAVRAFATERLAAPQHETREEAWRHLLSNGRKLRNVILEREAVDISRENYKAGGDWEAAMKLARTAQDRMREKHGMGASTNPTSVRGEDEPDPEYREDE